MGKQLTKFHKDNVILKRLILFLVSNMSQPLPSRTHLNPKFSGVHINPNFKGKSETTPPQSNVHVNPNFKKNESQQSTSTSNIHVNPNFSNRALPPIPGSSLPQPPTPSSPKSKAKAHI